MKAVLKRMWGNDDIFWIPYRKTETYSSVVICIFFYLRDDDSVYNLQLTGTYQVLCIVLELRR